MRESFSLEQSAEVATARHPELHEPYPEKVDDVVTEWTYRERDVVGFSDAELEEWQNEFALVEDEHLQPHQVNVQTMEQAARRISEQAAERGQPRFQENVQRVNNLLKVIRQAIADYAAAVRHHSRVSHEAGFRDNSKVRLRTANNNRSKAHEYLIDVLETHRQAVQTVMPKNQTAAFPKSQLSTSGAGREFLGHWALDMDIAIKAQVLQDIMTGEMEKRKNPDAA